jgi:hypothetical protein
MDWSIALFAVFALLGVGLLVYSLLPTFSPVTPPSTIAPQEAPPVTPSADLDFSSADIPEERVEPTLIEPAVNLPAIPSLNDSDTVLRREAERLSALPPFQQWIAPEDLIRRFVVIVENLAVGNSPTQELEFMAPDEEFSATVNEDGKWVTQPKSFARYDLMANVFDSLHVPTCMHLFQRWLPLFQEAYAELGYPAEGFQNALVMAIDELLATPVPEFPPILVQRTSRYAYENPLLEGLSPAQRQLLRMGSANTILVQAKLRVFRSELTRSAD